MTGLKINCAFTLAETLITLVIIGIVAALTIPTIINNHNKQETISKLKKNYSTLAQATNMIIQEEGSPMGTGSWVSDSNKTYELYRKKLVNAKECNNSTGCVTSEYKQLSNASAGNWDSSGRKLILADGTVVHIRELSNSCSYQRTFADIGSDNVCGVIHVDLNGAKKPNTIGRDIFTFVIKKNGLYYSGCDDETRCNKRTWGYACACKVIRENAINY